MKMTLPTDSAIRKDVPIYSGFIVYFPAAIAGAAKVSVAGVKQHGLAQLGHNRGKSADHPDCVFRHMMDAADLLASRRRGPVTESEEDIDRILTEASQAVWRVCAWSQELHEKFGRAPMAPAAFIPAQVPPPPGAADIPEFLRKDK